MLIHELDDAFDFSEVHGGWPSRLDWLVLGCGPSTEDPVGIVTQFAPGFQRKKRADSGGSSGLSSPGLPHHLENPLQLGMGVVCNAG